MNLTVPKAGLFEYLIRFRHVHSETLRNGTIHILQTYYPHFVCHELRTWEMSLNTIFIPHLITVSGRGGKIASHRPLETVTTGYPKLVQPVAATNSLNLLTRIGWDVLQSANLHAVEVKGNVQEEILLSP